MKCRNLSGEKIASFSYGNNAHRGGFFFLGGGGGGGGGGGVGGEGSLPFHGFDPLPTPRVPLGTILRYLFLADGP